jgi:hypothetical protein
MAHGLFALVLTTSSPVAGQAIQIGYDLRHSVDPEHNQRDFVTASFDYFKTLDYGSVLLKVDADLGGRNGNLGKLYTQLSHSLKFWQPPVFLHLEYAGGLGFVGESQSAYHITNTYSIGAAHPFPLLGSWASTFLAYRFTNFDTPSHDPIYSFWWGRDLGQRVSVTAYFVVWTINRNRGDEWTADLNGKKLSGVGEPQLWLNLDKQFAVGSEVRLYYQVFDYDQPLQVYPTVALKYQF